MRSRILPVGLVLAVGIAFSGVWALSRAQTVNVPPKYMLTDKHLVILSAPQVVAGPVVMDAKWSPDGVRVAAVRKTERSVLDRTIGEMHLVLWSAGRQSHEIWHNEMTLEAQPHIAWISPETVTVDLIWREKLQAIDAAGRATSTDVLRQGILWVNAVHEDAKMIATMPGDHLYVSPSQPSTVLLSPGQHQLFVLSPAGNVLKKLPLPEKTYWPRFREEDDWSADGIHVWLDATESVNGNGSQTTLKTYALNVQTGALEEGIKPEAVNRIPHPSALHLTQTFQDVKLGRRIQRLHPLWLESSTGGERPEALLAADSAGGTLCPIGESVLYLSGQAAWVTPLRIGPKEPFVSNLKAALQSNAKQLGLAMAMYSQDYDNALPTPDMPTQDAFYPYLKTTNLYDGFDYTFPGGVVPAGNDRGTTELGSIDGPGGRWIIFGDGHVVWRTP